MAIETSSGYIKEVRSGVINKALTPQEFRVEIRPLTQAGTVDQVKISAAPLNPQTIEVHPETPDFDDSRNPLQQVGDTASLCLVLGTGLKNIQTAAKALIAENKALGAGS